MADGLVRVREKYGPLAIAGAVSGAFFSRGLVMAQLTRALGTPNWLINQDLCGGCRGVTEKMTGLNIAGGEDIDNAACVMIVGRNPLVADPPQWMALKQAKARGARVLVIDPFQTSAAEMADLWLRPRPGTDGAIALAMTKVLIDEDLYDRDDVANWCHGFDALAERVGTCTPEWAERQTGVPAAQIVAAARMFADGPSCFISGHGIDAASNGVQTFRAYYCLFAISGNVDRVGGNRRAKRPAGFKTYFDILFDPAFRLPPEVEAQRIGAAQFPLWAGPLGYQMACHNPSVIEAILTGRPYPVRALYASGVNIAVTYPDTARTIEALQSLDLYVVAAHTMTPTAAWADLVLPKTTTLEEEEINLNQKAPCVTYTGATARRDGDVKSDLEIAVGLIDRLAARGAADPKFLPWRTRDEFNDYLVRDSAIDIAALKRTGYAEFPYALRDFAAHPFATPSGKIELWSQQHGAQRARSAPGLHSARLSARGCRDDRGLSARAADRIAREDLSPLALSRAGLDEEGVARSGRLPASRDGGAVRRRGRGLDQGRGGRRLGLVPAQGEGDRRHAAGRADHRRRLVAARRAGAAFRRARREHQCGALLSHALRSRERLGRHARDSVPDRAGGRRGRMSHRALG